jgi:hypothetical protein
MLTTKARRPLRTAGAGRPGGSGAQPPLHLIYMVKVGRPFLWVLRRKPNFWAGGFSFKEALADCLKHFARASEEPRNVDLMRLYFDNL